MINKITILLFYRVIYKIVNMFSVHDLFLNSIWPFYTAKYSTRDTRGEPDSIVFNEDLAENKIWVNIK